MEHHLSRETLNYANLVHTAAPTADESLDLIVPDAQPDILRIISAEPEIFVRSKDAENGKATVSGTVRVNIIYAPESGDGARKLAVEVPYSLSTSDANLTSASRVVARVGVDSADAVIVNPRKLTARVNVVGELRCFNDESVEVPTAEGLGDADDIETLPYSAELNLPTDVREKIFTVNDDVALPASNAPLSELLSSKATIAPEETKVVGSKLIFKGSAYTDLLYLTENGDTASAAVKSEFSQILELELADAESEFEVIPLVTASYVDPITGGDYAEKRVAIEIHAVGQVVATSKRKLRYIADAYSTKNNLELKPQPTQFTEFSEPHVVSAVLRGTIPAPNAARVVSLTANAGATTVEHSNGEVSAKTPVTVKALYSDNDGALRTAVSKFEANTALPNANSANVLAHVSTGRDTYGAASDGAIEIRVPIELRANEVVSPELSPIASVAYDETAPSDNTQKPSLVIARAKRGDTLWSVAKRYSATREHVRDVNALEDENIGEGSMLVIPRKK